MTAPFGPIAGQPENRNFLAQNGFQFIFSRFPNTMYFMQKFILPAISLGSVKVATPFSSLPLAGDHLDWGELHLDFIVDEDMKNYEELFNWFMELGLPDDFSLASKVYNPEAIQQGNGPSTTGTLIVLNSSLQQNIKLDFVDIFPIGLTSIQFDLTNTDIEYRTCTATFNYRRFYFNRN